MSAQNPPRNRYPSRQMRSRLLAGDVAVPSRALDGGHDGGAQPSTRISVPQSKANTGWTVGWEKYDLQRDDPKFRFGNTDVQAGTAEVVGHSPNSVTVKMAGKRSKVKIPRCKLTSVIPPTEPTLSPTKQADSQTQPVAKPSTTKIPRATKTGGVASGRRSSLVGKRPSKRHSKPEDPGKDACKAKQRRFALTMDACWQARYKRKEQALWNKNQRAKTAADAKAAEYAKMEAELAQYRNGGALCGQTVKFKDGLGDNAASLSNPIRDLFLFDRLFF